MKCAAKGGRVFCVHAERSAEKDIAKPGAG